MNLDDHYFTIQTKTMIQMLDKLKITCKMINLFHTTDLFLYPLMFSGGIERGQWHDMAELSAALGKMRVTEKRCLLQADHINSNFLKAVFRKFYLDHY